MSKGPRRGRRGSFQYDVCLSFAGEDRAYVERVSQELNERGIRVFYDKHEEVTLWGKDLYDHLDYIYRKAARFCVLFVSRHYASKVWTNHERRSMQARALRENEEYILPARFDTTELPGLRETVGYVRLKNRSPKQLADLIASKIGPRQRSDFLPPYPDRLYGRMHARKNAEKEEIDAQLRSFHEAWSRMEPDERRVVVDLLLNGCPEKLPKNFHINLDLLRRETGFPTPKIEQILGNLSSLGFCARIRQSKQSKELVQQRFVELEFNALNTAVKDAGPHNPLLQAICDEFGDELCRECAREALMRGDFSQLSSSTLEVEKHGRVRRALAKIN
jgi:TIR domain